MAIETFQDCHLVTYWLKVDLYLVRERIFWVTLDSICCCWTLLVWSFKLLRMNENFWGKFSTFGGNDNDKHGFPAYSHQLDSHQVGFWHYDERWKDDTVKFPPSQVPQPTCYWKWVGFPIPLKQANLTLRASSSAILRYSVLNGCFLSSYGSQRALTPMWISTLHPVLL